MKRLLIVLCTFLLFMGSYFVVPISAKAGGPQVNDIIITDEDISNLETVTGIYDVPANSTPVMLSSGLITNRSIRLSISGNNLIVSGYTYGISSVNKIGFTYVTLQRQGNGTWRDYVKWTELFNSSSRYDLGKSINAARGYNYRVICNHHAQKPGFLWFTEKEDIYNETSSLYF